ncbi:MAG: ATP-dependent helicase [Bdellovibrionaceae bacterium]|nr:ATP-dependent helicase [Pseudobdellovibrionaceae bacterium]
MSWYQGLNPEQQKAVAHNYGPLLILAGAGSGKTTVLVARTGRMIMEKIAKANEILVLTFTNKAAKELKHRVALKVGSPAKKIWAGTFHSFGLSLIKKYHKELGLDAHFGIIDTSDSFAILKEMLKENKVVGRDKFDLEHLYQLIQDIRTGKRKHTEAFDEYHEMAELLAPKYEKRLTLLSVVDFESLLLKPLELFEKFPDIKETVRNQFSQIMVDEFQDTNDVQMRLINHIINNQRNITVVGDDDQSIYGWRGAEVKNILHFPKEHKNCEVIKLERNYRSISSILDFANEVISKNKSRHGKILKAETKKKRDHIPEFFVIENEEEESEFVGREVVSFIKQGYAPSDIAILYRSNSQGAWIEGSLRRNNVDYSITGGSSIFERKEIKDVIAFLRHSFSGNDVTLKRIINIPSRGIGETTMEKMIEYAKKLNINFMQASRQWRQMNLPQSTGDSLEFLFDFLDHLPSRILGLKDQSTLRVQLDFERESFHTRPVEGTSPGDRFLNLLRELGYREYLFSLSEDLAVGEKRWTLVEIFCRIMDSYLNKRDHSVDSLKGFIESLLLRDDVMEADEDNRKVQLMTLHASKGLEFPVVILCGVEEDLLPHKNLGHDIDEERRLFYVGVTRAQEHLILTKCQNRKKNGVIKMPSLWQDISIR